MPENRDQLEEIFLEVYNKIPKKEIFKSKYFTTTEEGAMEAEEPPKEKDAIEWIFFEEDS
jgi:hypothetical protein